MSAIETMLGTPLAQAIGWALVHIVWQGIVVAGILAALLALLQRQSAHARYVVSCAAMLVLLTLGAVTAYRAYDAGGDALIVSPQTATIDDAAPSQSGDTPTLFARTRAALPKIVLFWIVGVAALSFRLAGGWLRAQRLAKRNASPAAAEWQQTVARLSDALGLRRGVELLHSAAVEVPTVLGWLRPVILLPLTLSGLSPEQIEMILAHELAHIRRHDFLVNLMQSVVETLLFYHPAVWWISARIRIEREHCCDDAAVAIGGNALQYARALTRLEELRGDTTQLALAANGGSLIERIRRVAGIRGEGPSRWVAGAALLTVVAVLFVAPSLPLLARDQTTPPAPPAAPAAPPAIASTPAAPAPPAIAQSHVEVRAEAASEDDGDVVDVPEPPEAPDPPEQPAQPAPPATPVQPRAHAPHAPRTPRAPRATTPACPDSINVHVAPMVMPKIEMAPMAMPKIAIPPIDVHIDGIPGGIRGGIEGGVRGGIEGGVRRALEPPQKYKAALRGAGLTATEHEAAQLYMMGVTPRYVQSLHDAGLKKLTAHDVIRLHSMGITANFVKELKRMQQ